MTYHRRMLRSLNFVTFGLFFASAAWITSINRAQAWRWLALAKRANTPLFNLRSMDQCTFTSRASHVLMRNVCCNWTLFWDRIFKFNLWAFTCHSIAFVVGICLLQFPFSFHHFQVRWLQIITHKFAFFFLLNFKICWDHYCFLQSLELIHGFTNLICKSYVEFRHYVTFLFTFPELNLDLFYFLWLIVLFAWWVWFEYLFEKIFCLWVVLYLFNHVYEITRWL